MLDVGVEHLQAASLTVADLKRFVLAEQVRPSTLKRTWDGVYAPIKRDRVVFERRQSCRFEFARYRPEDEPVNAYVAPVFDVAGELADVLAFRPDGQVALWLGAVSMAGEEEVFGPRLDDPLDAHAGIMDWLRADRRGIVILDHAKAARRLEGVTIRATGTEHARRLRVALARPAPRIVAAAAAQLAA